MAIIGRGVGSILALSVAASAGAQTQDVTKVEILNYGLYAGERIRSEAAPSVTIGKFDELSGVKNIEITTVVPAQIGERFGFEFRPTGILNGEPIALTIVTNFPKPGLRNSETGNSSLHDVYDLKVNLGANTAYIYTFEKPWELVCGKWQFEIWYRSQKLAEQDFQVVSPSCAAVS